MSKQKVIWECGACGHSQAKWSGSCLQCNEWNTFIEQIHHIEKNVRFDSKKPVQPVCITEIEDSEVQRIQSSMKEFNRLLGGGVVLGALTLVGGAPGIGKSTLLLQVSHAYASQGLKVLYICGEESYHQTSLRAKRVGVSSKNLFLYSETNFSLIKQEIENLKPNIVIVDSIQIVYKSDIPSAPGSVAQVRELAMEFLHLSKGHGITTFLVGHVTKSGEIAGPKVLEHMVDTVLEFDADCHQGLRLLRCLKNRFGPTDDVALFTMKETGLEEIQNPSLVFIEQRAKQVSGSIIVPTMEGIRPMLIEIQALVTPSVFATPSRKCTGLDPNRLALLLAVLEKRAGYRLHTYDVFVSIAGGLKIKEPALDLGIILAIASSFSNKMIPSHTVAIGEIGLGGEVRSVNRLDSRLKEVLNMGFKECYLPIRSIKNISKQVKEKITLHGIEMVEDVMRSLIF